MAPCHEGSPTCWLPRPFGSRQQCTFERQRRGPGAGLSWAGPARSSIVKYRNCIVCRVTTPTAGARLARFGFSGAAIVPIGPLCAGPTPPRGGDAGRALGGGGGLVGPTMIRGQLHAISRPWPQRDGPRPWDGEDPRRGTPAELLRSLCATLPSTPAPLSPAGSAWEACAGGMAAFGVVMGDRGSHPRPRLPCRGAEGPLYGFGRTTCVCLFAGAEPSSAGPAPVALIPSVTQPVLAPRQRMVRGL